MSNFYQVRRGFKRTLSTNRHASPEHAVQTEITNWLKAHGYYVIRNNSGAIPDARGHLIRLAPAGTPDLMAFKMKEHDRDICTDACCFGQDIVLYFIEVKRDKTCKPTDNQIRKMSELTEAGAICFIATSIEDLESRGL